LKVHIVSFIVDERKRVWAGCHDGMIRIYDGVTANLQQEFQAHNGTVNCLLYSTLGVWSGGTDFGLKLWDVTV